MEGRKIDMNFEAFKFLNSFMTDLLEAQGLPVKEGYQLTRAAADVVHRKARELAPLMEQQFMPGPSSKGEPK